MGAGRSPGPGALLVAPAVALVTVVLGTGLVAVVGTGLGLVPLIGEPSVGPDAFVVAGPDLLAGLRESLQIAVAATVLAVGLGLAVALLVLRTGSPTSAGRRGGRLLGGVIAGVIPVPHLVGAASVGLLLADAGLAARVLGVAPDSWPELVSGRWPVATVLEFAWKEAAFVALVVVATVGPRLTELTETAALLGADARRRLLRLTLPLAAPALTAAGVIVFLYTVGAYEVSWLLGRAYPEPLPVLAYRLFTSIELTARPQAAAAALTAVGLSLVAAAAAVPLLHRVGAAR